MNLTEQFAHMATGAMYDDLTPELVTARIETVRATDAYNRSYGRPAEEREALLRRIVGSMGREVSLEPTFRCEFGRNIHLGSHRRQCASGSQGRPVHLQPRAGSS